MIFHFIDHFINKFLHTFVQLSVRLPTGHNNRMAGQGEVYRVNKLIEIEHLDWTKQLEKAVRGFSFLALTPLIFGSFLYSTELLDFPFSIKVSEILP